MKSHRKSASQIVSIRRPLLPRFDFKPWGCVKTQPHGFVCGEEYETSFLDELGISNLALVPNLT